MNIVLDGIYILSDTYIRYCVDSFIKYEVSVG